MSGFDLPTIKPNPAVYTGPREPINPKSEGMVRLWRYGIDLHIYNDVSESSQVFDGSVWLAVGRVAARYDANSRLTVLYQGQQWRVETWREQAMRLDKERYEWKQAYFDNRRDGREAGRDGAGANDSRPCFRCGSPPLDGKCPIVGCE